MVTVVTETIGDFTRNRFTFTEAFDNAKWVKIGVTVTPNDEIGPDGEMSGTLLSPTGSTANRLRYQNLTPGADFTVGNIVCTSFRIKNKDSVLTQIFVSTNTPSEFTQARIDWSTNTIAVTSTSGPGAHIAYLRPADEYGYFRAVVGHEMDLVGGGGDILQTEITPDVTNGTGEIWIAQAQQEERDTESVYQPQLTAADAWTGDFLTIADWLAAYTDPVADDSQYIGQLLDGAHVVNTNELACSIPFPKTTETQNRRLTYLTQPFSPRTGLGPRVIIQWLDSTSNQDGFDFDEQWFEIDGVGFFDEDPELLDPVDGQSLNLIKVSAGGDDVRFRNCFIKCSESRVDDTNAVIIAVKVDGDNVGSLTHRVRFFNCIGMGGAHGRGAAFIFQWGQFTRDGGAFNCDAYLVTRDAPNSSGFSTASQSGFGQDIINCRASKCQGTTQGLDFAGPFVTFSNNLSSDASATGIDFGNTTNKKDIPAQDLFINADAHDFRAPQSSIAVDGGQNAIIVFQANGAAIADIENQTRMDPWTIGAYEGSALVNSTGRTDVVESIGPEVNGRHFSTVDDWLEATEGLNLHSRNERRIGELYAVGGDFNIGTRTLRARRTVTSLGRVRELRAHADSKYDPVEDRGAKIIGSALQDRQVMHIQETGFDLSDIAMEQSTSASTARGLLLVSGHSVRFDSLFLIWKLGTVASSVCCDIAGGSSLVTNCIAIGGGAGFGATVGFRIGNANIPRIFNCTTDAIKGVSSTGKAFLVETDYDRAEVQGCIGSDSSTCFSVTGGQPGSIRMSANISTDATATGTGSQINVSRAALFHLVGVYDFRNLLGSPAIKAGRNLNVFFSDDFRGTRRRAPFDVGAYEGIPYSILGAKPEMRRDYAYTCKLFEIVRSDGQSVFLTDANVSIPHGGQTYNPVGGVLSSASRGEGALREGSSSFSGTASVGSIFDPELISGGLFGDASVIERTIDFRVPYQIPLRTLNYTVSSIRNTERSWSAEVSGPSRAYARSVGGIAKPACGVAFGSDACGIDVQALTLFDVRVTTIVDDRREFDSNATDISASFADDYFGNGRIVWLTGDNTGTEAVVKSYSQATRRIVLAHRSAKPIQTADEYQLSPGCRLRYLEDCVNKYSNGSRHRGQPIMPTTDQTFLRP